MSEAPVGGKSQDRTEGQYNKKQSDRAQEKARGLGASLGILEEKTQTYLRLSPEGRERVGETAGWSAVCSAV